MVGSPNPGWSGLKADGQTRRLQTGRIEKEVMSEFLFVLTQELARDNLGLTKDVKLVMRVSLPSVRFF